MWLYFEMMKAVSALACSLAGKMKIIPYKSTRQKSCKIFGASVEKMKSRFILVYC